MSQPPSDPPVRVLIVDDHAAFRAGLRSLLGTDTGIAVVGEASSGASAVAASTSLTPDVVLMDVAMPGLDGVEATRRITDAVPHVAVIVLTMHDDDETVFSALRAGARGYLLKGASRAELLRAVRAAAAGEALLGPPIARRLIGYFGRAMPATAEPFPDLTEREREVLDLLAAGRSNAEIAERIGVASKTVRNHVSNVFAKLHVRDRAEAILRAREAGLGRPTDR